MRLFFPVLLVTLAFCCYEANANTCPSLLIQLKTLLTGTMPEFKIILQKYDAPPEAVQAELKAKRCIDGIPEEYRVEIQNLVKNVASTCES